MIRVLIVDDSAIQQELLKHVFSTDPDIMVIDTASNGLEAIEKIKKIKPDVVTMDIHMPKMDGIQATQTIMSTTPVPIVIISGSYSEFEVSHAFKAIEAGALAIVEKLNYVVDDPHELIDTVKISAGVKVVRRIQHQKKTTVPPILKNLKMHPVLKDCKVITIGVSTGGPLILKEIFEKLHDQFPPILVVQHISVGFLKGLAEWLSNTTNKSINIAVSDQKIESNKIYLAPDGRHMGINSQFKIVLEEDKTNKGHIPAVNKLFTSVGDIAGKNALGIILTGMGKDGALGLKYMKDMGAYTIAQDKETAVIFGMPSEAIAIQGVTEVLNPSEIAHFINHLNNNDHEK